MNSEPTSSIESAVRTGVAVGAPHPTEAYGDFLNCFGRAVKCISLYGASHPLTINYVKDALYQVGQVVLRTRRDRLVLTAAGERVLVNGARPPETAMARDIVRGLFVGHGLKSLSLLAGTTLSELSSLCELAAVSGKAPGEGDLQDFISLRGATHILFEAEGHSPRPTEIPPSSAPPASSPPRRSQGLSFGTLLKSIVESAASDPEERLHLYQDAAGLVKEALSRRVEEATRELRQEKQRILGEQARTEHVLSKVADGQVIVDKQGKILMMNPAAEEISGKRLVDVAGKHIMESVDPRVQMVAMSQDLELPAEGHVFKEIRVIAQEEVERALRRSLALVQDDAGRVVGTYAVLPDVAKYKETLRLQEEFLSRVTHDLKAPLASISCGLELLALRVGPRMAPEEAGFVDICLKNTHQLGRMISEILDFSKLESGKMTVRAVATPAASMLAEAVEGLGPWAQTKGLSLAAQPVLPGLTVRADPIRVVQILTNLISNAIKSTPSGGRVVVAATPGVKDDRDCAIFSVKDTGNGIPQESLRRVFEKFFKLEGPQGYREGVGLGLTIVQDLVGLHGGRVWAESEVGAGATFFFTLPLAAAAEVEESSWQS